MKNKLTAKIFQVLEIISSSPEPLSLKKISEVSGIAAGTLSRIVADLCECGMIEKFGYHQVRPSLGMIRFGQDAMTNFSLPRIVPPMLRSHAEGVGADGAFAGVHNLKLVYICSNSRRSGGGSGSNLPYWEPLLRSFLAAVILGSELPGPELDRVVHDNFRSASPSDIDFFLNNCLSVKKNGYIAYREFGRGWSVNFPVTCNDRFYGVALSGQNAETCNLDRMIFETSLLASRLSSALDEDNRRR